ncbi:helix-turn-helix domain-containing protein [Microbacterium deminutum]|uniref:helix-turn-helix domain-containing protein n=1 Tax=Microbacterium deminutum TaxID=344164 RepID=UPI003CD095F2
MDGVIWARREAPGAPPCHEGLRRRRTRPDAHDSELAEYLGVKPQVIYDLRRGGEGPRGFHVGKELRYCVPEIKAWLESRSDPLRERAADAR